MLEATISAAELYLQALRLAEDPLDRKRVDAKCRTLLKRAEELKASRQNVAVNGGIPAVSLRTFPRKDLKQPESTRQLSTRENIILLEGSKLNGFVFKPWDVAPSSPEFELSDGQSLYEDHPRLPLSTQQMLSFDGWERPQDALSRIHIMHGDQMLPNTPTMVPTDQVDLVQDLTSDCSVVASLCAGISRAAKGHQKVIPLPGPDSSTVNRCPRF